MTFILTLFTQLCVIFYFSIGDQTEQFLTSFDVTSLDVFDDILDIFSCFHWPYKMISRILCF